MNLFKKLLRAKIKQQSETYTQSEVLKLYFEARKSEDRSIDFNKTFFTRNDMVNLLHGIMSATANDDLTFVLKATNYQKYIDDSLYKLTNNMIATGITTQPGTITNAKNI